MSIAYANSSESHTGTTGSTSQTSFTWNHTPTGTPQGVAVFVFQGGTTGSTNASGAVTYGGVNVPAISGAVATDTATELGQVKAYFLGNNVPSGTQAVVVNRTNNATVLYAVALTVTASGRPDIHTAGIVLLQENGTYTQQAVTDGQASGTNNSLRVAGGYYGGSAAVAVGANTTLAQNITVGATYGFTVGYETVAGIGSRSMGFANATSDDRAAVHFAIKDIPITGLSATNNSLTVSAPTATRSASCNLSAGANSITVTAPTATRIQSSSVSAGTNSVTVTAPYAFAKQAIKSYDQIAGTLVNGIYRTGPFYYNNNYYYFGVHVLWPLVFRRIGAVKVAHATSVTISTVTECDVVGSPVTGGDYIPTQVYAVQSGTTVHVLYSDSNGTVKYAPFNLATETWGTAETVLTEVSNLVTDDLSLAYRETSGELVFTYSISGGSVYYARRSSGGSWSTGNVVYSGSAYGTADRTFAIGERVYLFYAKTSPSNQVCVKVLNASNVLGSEVQVQANPATIAGGSVFKNATTGDYELLVATSYRTSNGGDGSVRLYRLTDADTPTVTSVGVLGATLNNDNTHIIGDTTSNRVLIVSPDTTSGSLQGLRWTYDTVNGLSASTQYNSGQTNGATGVAYSRGGSLRQAFMWGVTAYLTNIEELTLGTVEFLNAGINTINVVASEESQSAATNISAGTNTTTSSAPTATANAVRNITVGSNLITVTVSDVTVTTRTALSASNDSITISAATTTQSATTSIAADTNTATATAPSAGIHVSYGILAGINTITGSASDVTVTTRTALSASNDSITISAPDITKSVVANISAGTNTATATAPTVTTHTTCSITVDNNTITSTAPTATVAAQTATSTGSNNITLSAPAVTTSTTKLRVELRHNSGTVLIAAWDIQPTEDWTLSSYTLTQEEFEAISDWGDLQLWFIADGRRIDIAQAGLCAPNQNIVTHIHVDPNDITLTAVAPTVYRPVELSTSLNSITSSAPSVTIRVTQHVDANQITVTPSVVSRTALATQNAGVATATITAPITTHVSSVVVAASSNTITTSAPIATGYRQATLAAGSTSITVVAPTSDRSTVVVRAAGTNTITSSAPAQSQTQSVALASGANSITSYNIAPSIHTQRTLSVDASAITATAPKETIQIRTVLAAATNQITSAAPTSTRDASRNSSSGANAITVVAPIAFAIVQNVSLVLDVASADIEVVAGNVTIATSVVTVSTNTNALTLVAPTVSLFASRISTVTSATLTMTANAVVIRGTVARVAASVTVQLTAPSIASISATTSITVIGNQTTVIAPIVTATTVRVSSVTTTSITVVANNPTTYSSIFRNTGELGIVISGASVVITPTTICLVGSNSIYLEAPSLVQRVTTLNVESVVVTMNAVAVAVAATIPNSLVLNLRHTAVWVVSSHDVDTWYIPQTQDATWIIPTGYHKWIS